MLLIHMKTYTLYIDYNTFCQVWVNLNRPTAYTERKTNFLLFRSSGGKIKEFHDSSQLIDHCINYLKQTCFCLLQYDNDQEKEK